MADSEPGSQPDVTPESPPEASPGASPGASKDSAESAASETKAAKKSSAKSSEKKSSGKAKKSKANNDAASDAAPKADGEHHLQQHHVSKILDEVLDEPEDALIPGRLKHPMWLDVTLAIGLLFTVGGFTIGLFKIYINHTADQAITQHNYKAAIAILKGTPFPGFFTIPGSDPDELLSQALYLDAMDKLEVDNDVDSAIGELQQIQPGSRFFQLAQDIISDNFEPSSTQLEGGASFDEHSPAKASAEKKPILPELKDASP